MISTLMQPIVNQNDLFVDNNEQPLVQGRLDFLDPVSNNYIDVYSYSEDEYTILTNPIILDVYGRTEQSVFSDRLTYCRLYAFRGYDEHNQPIYEFVRDWYAGHNAQSEISDTVYGIEALRDLDPEFNTNVMVIGYHNEHDCGPRNYYWDENSTLDVDNVYVVGSDHSSTGRWILNFDGEYLPSTFAGVYPGKVANINALLSYVETINGQKTAPGVWFVPGNYSVETNLQTTKRVLLDAGTSFTCQYFYCGNLKVVGEPQAAICDFDFYDNEQEAHSSWFKTVFGFLTSNAKKYILDARDNFVNKTLQASVTLQDKIIEGQTRLPVTYTGSGKITLRNCVINAERIFNYTDILSFAYTEIHDHWWNNPADIDFYGKVAARTISMNSLVIDNFTNMTAYVNAVGADGQQVLDMAGRSIYNLELPLSVVELRNVHVTNNANIPANGRDITLRNCEFANASVTSRYLTVYDSRIHFYMEPSVSAMWGYNSEIRSGSDFVNKAAQYVFEDCKVGINFKRVTDNDTRDAFLEFTRCNFENCVIESKTLRMMNCDCEGCTIKIYPYKDNDVYKMYCYLEGNRFISGQPVEFTKVDLIDGAYQDNVYDIQVSWTIINNFFAGNTEGLRCRYWQHRTGSNYGKTFIKINGHGVNNVVYKGNSGDCPSETASEISADTQSNNDWYWVELGNNQFQSLFKRKTATKRLMPNLMESGGIAYNAWLKPVDDSKLCVKWRWQDSDTLNIVKNTWVYPWSHLNDPVENGDLFLYGMSLFGKVTQSSPGRVESLEFL